MFKKLLFIFISLFVLCTSFLYAELSHNVDLTVSGGMGYSSTKLRNWDNSYDNLYVAGGGKLAYTMSGRGTLVRGQARISITGTESLGFLLEMSRAYIRTRFPIPTKNDIYNLQLELGKNSLAWGEGIYYNAGDVIFGSNPRTSDLSSAEFRDYAFWQLRLFFPITDFIYIETVMGFPDQIYIINELTKVVVPSSDLKELGAGLRFHAETGPLVWELGGYSRFVAEQFSPYISISLPLVVQLYIASSIDFDFSANRIDYYRQFESSAKVSGGVLFIQSVGAEGTLTLQPEILYQNYQWYAQLSSAWFFKRVIGMVLRGEFAFIENRHSILVGPQWKPEDGFTFSFYSSTIIDIQDNADENIFVSGITLQMQYKF